MRPMAAAAYPVEERSLLPQRSAEAHGGLEWPVGPGCFGFPLAAAPADGDARAERSPRR